MDAFYRKRWRRVLVPVILVAVWLIPCAVGVAQNSEAEQNYQRFLKIYRQDRPSRAELKQSLTYLEAANLLAPDTYKYVYSLGALNNTLSNYQEAAEWLEKAKHLAVTEQQQQSIDSELDFCSIQLARLKTMNRDRRELSISFIMKEGTVEMDADTIRQLPRVLPVIDAAGPAQPLASALAKRLEGMRLRVLEKSPFLVVGLNDRISPEAHYEKGIRDFYRFFSRTYFEHPPRRMVVAVISENPRDLAEATGRLYPTVTIPVYAPFLGYYNPSDNLIMATGGHVGYGTLLHEMIHALVASDFPQAPAWLNEGLASLYERTEWQAGRLVPLPNWRMDRMREESVPTLAELAGKMPRIGLHSHDVKEVRVLLLFLDQRRQVDDLYKMVKQQGSSFDFQTAVSALGPTETEWRAFVKTLFREYHAEMAAGRGSGFHPDEVRFLQEVLNATLGTGLKVDGRWGARTQEAVVAFQRRFGLQPDGMLGPKTWEALKRQYALVRVASGG